jgi:benzodiazapine receptor
MNEFWTDWGPTLIAAFGVTILAFTGGAVTTIGPWYRGLNKPSWQPPNWLFAPAWTTIFILEAASAVIGWKCGAGFVMIGVFIVNGLFNILWSVLFFARRRPDQALYEVGFLWLSVLAMIVVIGHFAGRAWWLLLPYLLWVSFAAFLNYTIVRLNAPFGAAEPRQTA